jgi:hypothetical protein
MRASQPMPSDRLARLLGPMEERSQDQTSLPAADLLLASAARFLIDGGEEDAASVVLSCSLEVWESGDSWYVGDETVWALHITLTGPRSAYGILTDKSHEVTVQITKALEAVLPHDRYIKHLTAHAELLEIDPDWRTELLEIARGRGVHNQAVREAPRTWRNLRFRSESEIRIAQALERAEVLFLPNCMARLGIADNRKNREADFLVCASGKWGILEVDGEPFHPPSRAAHDHERDRLFRDHGIRLVEHFDASECFERADAVVARFLGLLLRS